MFIKWTRLHHEYWLRRWTNLPWNLAKRQGVNGWAFRTVARPYTLHHKEIQNRPLRKQEEGGSQMALQVLISTVISYLQSASFCYNFKQPSYFFGRWDVCSPCHLVLVELMTCIPNHFVILTYQSASVWVWF